MRGDYLKKHEPKCKGPKPIKAMSVAPVALFDWSEMINDDEFSIEIDIDSVSEIGKKRKAEQPSSELE